MSENKPFGKIPVKLLHPLCVFLGGIILCSQAFYNGFPLLYPDSGTYIAACFEGFLPVDRPLVYSFFIRHLSLAVTLWIPIIVQATIVAWLVWLLFQYVGKNARPYGVYFFTLIFLSLTTGIAVNCSQLIADVFTPVTLLTSAFLLFIPELPRWKKIALSILFIFAVSTHLSHFPMMAGILVWVVIAWFVNRKKKPPVFAGASVLKFMALLPLAVLFSCVLNYTVAGKWQFRPGAQHVFMMNRLIECDIIDEYLDENCGKRTNTLCMHREHVRGDFLWDPNSAINKAYGWENNGWEKAKPEYDSITRDVFSQGKFVKRFLYRSWTDGCEQLVSFKTGTTPKLSDGDAVTGVFKWHFPNLLDEYYNARQNSSGLDYSILNTIQLIVVILAAILFFIFLLIPRFSKLLSPAMRAFGWMVITGMIVNAFAVVSFAMIDDRFQARLIWLIPLLLIVFLSNAEFRSGLKKIRIFNR